MPNPNDITEPDLTSADPEPTDWSSDALIRKINRANTIFTRMNGRLQDVFANMSPPPEPVKPVARTAINAVIATITACLNSAKQVKAKIG